MMIEVAIPSRVVAAFGRVIIDLKYDTARGPDKELKILSAALMIKLLHQQYFLTVYGKAIYRGIKRKQNKPMLPSPKQF